MDTALVDLRICGGFLSKMLFYPPKQSEIHYCREKGGTQSLHFQEMNVSYNLKLYGHFCSSEGFLKIRFGRVVKVK